MQVKQKEPPSCWPVGPRAILQAKGTAAIDVIGIPSSSALWAATSPFAVPVLLLGAAVRLVTHWERGGGRTGTGGQFCILLTNPNICVRLIVQNKFQEVLS